MPTYYYKLSRMLFQGNCTDMDDSARIVYAVIETNIEDKLAEGLGTGEDIGEPYVTLSAKKIAEEICSDAVWVNMAIHELENRGLIRRECTCAFPPEYASYEELVTEYRIYRN